MNALEAMIEDLSREQALEASRFLANELGAEPDEGQRAAVLPLVEQPYRNIREIEQLARLALLGAAAVDEYRDAVQRAVEGAGRKQFIFGGGELVVLAAIALSALHVVVTKGKSGESETITIEEEDGKRVTIIQHEIRYGVTAKLGGILKNYFAR